MHLFYHIKTPNDSRNYSDCVENVCSKHANKFIQITTRNIYNKKNYTILFLLYLEPNFERY